MMSNASDEPTPRPPLTTTFASRSDRIGAAGGVRDRSRPGRGRIRPVDGDRPHVAERLGKPERLQRQLVVRLDEDEDAHWRAPRNDCNLTEVRLRFMPGAPCG